MKPITSFSSAIAVCALVATQPVWARETAAQSAARRAIVAQYQKADNALMRKDIPTMMSTLAHDYVQYIPNGTANRAQTEALLRQSLADPAPGVSLRFTKVSSKILSLTWRGPDAIVMAQTTGVGVVSGAKGRVRIEVVAIARDYWGPSPTGWKVRQSVERESKMWHNGQRIR